MSATIFLPPMSTDYKGKFDWCSLKSLLSNNSRRLTSEFSLFGTSMPTAAWVGASIPMSEAAKFN